MGNGLCILWNCSLVSRKKNPNAAHLSSPQMKCFSFKRYYNPWNCFHNNFESYCYIRYHFNKSSLIRIIIFSLMRIWTIEQFQTLHCFWCHFLGFFVLSFYFSKCILFWFPWLGFCFLIFYCYNSSIFTVFLKAV